MKKESFISYLASGRSREKCVLPGILIKKKKINPEPLSCWNILLRDGIAVFTGHSHTDLSLSCDNVSHSLRGLWLAGMQRASIFMTVKNCLWLLKISLATAGTFKKHLIQPVFRVMVSSTNSEMTYL